MARQKHLSLSDRSVIETGLNRCASRTSIAEILNMDKSSICKEIKKHAFFKKKSSYGRNSHGTYDCLHLEKCGFKSFCTHACSERCPIPCKRKDAPSGVCNGCPKQTPCKLDKKLYEAKKAHDAYRLTLTDSREGINLTVSQAKSLGMILKPGIDQGQSIHAILVNHPEIDLCEKTIYNYLSDGVFSVVGLIDLDLRLKTSRKPFKKRIKSKTREDRKQLKGRTYQDFKSYMAYHPEAALVEMDTVYNDPTHGPFIQTFQLVDFNLMVGRFHDTKTAQSMLEGITEIHRQLGDKLFKKYFQVLLTDRGSEFSSADAIEKLGCKIFYCDPQFSWQKPHVENNHRIFRYVCPNGIDLRAAGLTDQSKLDLLFSHVNSYVREILHDRSPIEVFTFFYPQSTCLESLNIKSIDPAEINLTPSLLK